MYQLATFLCCNETLNYYYPVFFTQLFCCFIATLESYQDSRISNTFRGMRALQSVVIFTSLGVACIVGVSSLGGCLFRLLLVLSGFPRGIESTEKVLNFKIGFQDLEEVLNLAKMYIRY